MKITNLESDIDQREDLVIQFKDSLQNYYFDLDVEYVVSRNEWGEPYLDCYTFDVGNAKTYNELDEETAFTFTDSELRTIKELWLSKYEDELIDRFI